MESCFLRQKAFSKEWETFDSIMPDGESIRLETSQDIPSKSNEPAHAKTCLLAFAIVKFKEGLLGDCLYKA